MLFAWTKEKIDEFVRIMRKVDTLRGDGVTNQRDSIVISAVPVGGKGASASRGMFPVRVEKDGGDDGDADNPPDYTYTVSTLGGSQIGTEVEVVKPRSKGSFTEGSEYGVAFYDQGELKLWDAGEAENTDECDT